MLARDAWKTREDISAPVSPLRNDGELLYTVLPCEEGETIRLRLETDRGSVLLTDYASCGKHWAGSDGLITVWMPVC